MYHNTNSYFKNQKILDNGATVRGVGVIPTSVRVLL